MDALEHLMLCEKGMPIANISTKNFLGYEMLGQNRMRVRVKKLDPIHEIWHEASYEFDILPENKHMLRVRNWVQP